MRVVIATPDYPPAVGGIQRLMGELVERAAWQSLVITNAESRWASGRAFDQVLAVPVAHKARLGILNARVLTRGARWRPDAVLCGHVAVSPGAAALGRAMGVPVLQYVYASELVGRPSLTRFAVTHARATIAISNYTAGLAITAGAPPDRVTTIEPGVDAVPATAARDRARRPTILTVARLSDRYKGFDVMLRALPLVRSRVPDVRWVLVGDGELRGELEAIVGAWGLGDCVQFAGAVTEADRDAWYAAAHVFAMPSRVPATGAGEGYGLVYLEAGMRGLPCVAGDTGAVVEAVVHEESGLLVAAHDHAAVADALVTLLGDPERSARLGRAGRARAKERSWDRMAREVETLVERTVALGHR